MSYGIQTFSSNGSILLDTTGKTVTQVDAFALNSGTTQTRSYPGIADFSNFAVSLFPTQKLGLSTQPLYPALTFGKVNGVPTFSVTRAGNISVLVVLSAK